MKIGFDVSQTGYGKAGCGYFAEKLIVTLSKIDAHNHYILYPTFGNFFWNEHYSKTVHISHRHFSRGMYHNTFSELKTFWNNPPSHFEELLDSPDVLHSNNFFCPMHLHKTKLVYTLYDLSFIDYPEWTTEANRIGCFNGVFNASLYADHIIAISEYSKKHFIRLFPHFSEKKISVIYPASRFRRQGNIEKPNRLSGLVTNRFWLSVGTIEPRKNHKNLLLAYVKLKEQNSDLAPLVLAGGEGWLMNNFKQQIKNLALEKNVILLGYASDHELQWLYQNCFCFVYPSFFEGFGLPVLEAMTLGAPIITSQSSSLPEIVGKVYKLVDPFQVDTIFNAMQDMLQLSQSNRECLIHGGMLQAERFSWEKSAEKVLQLYLQFNRD